MRGSGHTVLTSGRHPGTPEHGNRMITMNLKQLLANQHVAYEADLEPSFYGINESPFDDTPTIDDHYDIELTIPCAYCGNTSECLCLDRGSPFAHLNVLHGW